MNPTKVLRTFAIEFFASAVLLAIPVCAQDAPHGLLYRAVTGKLPAPQIQLSANGRAATKNSSATSTRRIPFISGGLLHAAEYSMKAAGVLQGKAGNASPNSKAAANTAGRSATADDSEDFEDFFALGLSLGTVGCSKRVGQPSHHDVRVNQDCGFEEQSEEKISYNPTNPRNLLAGINDTRTGQNLCGIAFSVDNGRRWGDMVPQFRRKLNNPKSELPTTADPNAHTLAGDPGTFHSYDFASDPGTSFEENGTAHFSCVAADIFDPATMIFVLQSPSTADGSFFTPISTFGRHFVASEDNNPNLLYDKPFSTSDPDPYSPNANNAYVTWTVFRFGCPTSPFNPAGFCSETIFGSMSTDHGVTWSTPEEISGNSPVCFFGNIFDPTRDPHDCDLSQGSDPITLRSGQLVVVFNNGNTPADDPNAQQLAVLCSPGGSSPAGTAHLNCAPATKVGDDIILGEPLCDFGQGPQECIPGAFIRTSDLPRIAVHHEDGHVYVVWQDYRNGEYDIQMARSVDGANTWSDTVTVNPDSNIDHYFPAVDVVQNLGRDRVGVSYFRTARVPGENTSLTGVFAQTDPGVQAEPSDYVLSGGRGLQAPYAFKVVSPVFPPPDGQDTGFNGDYSGLVVTGFGEAHPIWSDTRNINPFITSGTIHDEDVFTVTVDLPGGRERD